jgi:hypothetical protein
MTINSLGASRAWSGLATNPRSAPAAVSQETGGSASTATAGASTVTLSAGARVITRMAEGGLSMSTHALQAPLQRGSAAREAPREQAAAFVPVGRDKLEELLA